MRAGVRPWLVLIALAGADPARGAGPYTIRAYVQPDQQIRDDQTLRLVIEIAGSSSPRAQAPAVGGLTNLRWISGPDNRANSVWMNGQFSTTLQWVYTLIPEGAGPAEIPAIEVVLDGKTYRTDPLRFEVVAAPPAGVPPPGGGADRSPQRDAQAADLFVEAQLGSNAIWVGQAVQLGVAIYTTRAITGTNLVGEPGLASFWVDKIEVDPEGENYQQTVDGRRYQVYPMLRRVLVPQTAGSFEIEPFVLQLQVRQRRTGDPFDLFSLGRPQTLVRKTQPLTLEVRRLPTSGRPPDFGGAVGRYDLSLDYDRERAAVNEAVVLTVTIEGEGTLRSVEAPSFEAPPELKVFPPKLSASYDTPGGRFVSRKSWEWVLVPLAPGEIRLPELSFSYFDPAREQYVTVRKAVGNLVVDRGTATAPDSGLARADVQVQRRDLAYIKPLRGALRIGAARLHERPWFLGLAALPLAWAPLAVGLGRRRARLQADQGLARARRARTRARKRLRTAHRTIASTEAGRFHEEVGRALVGYVADRFDRSAAGLTYDAADELLAGRGLDEQLRQRFRRCLESCDFARFVPASAQAARREELHREALTLVDELERGC